MWTVNEAPPRQFRNQLIEPAPKAESAAPDDSGALSYDTWRSQLALIRAALAPFPLAFAAVVAALEQAVLAGQAVVT
jgi:hypothetical protein